VTYWESQGLKPSHDAQGNVIGSPIAHGIRDAYAVTVWGDGAKLAAELTDSKPVNICGQPTAQFLSADLDAMRRKMAAAGYRLIISNQFGYKPT
jgi:hypothetical protein